VYPEPREFKQLRATDQVSCNGVSGLVLKTSPDGVRIHFDGDSGSAVLSIKDLGMLSNLRVVRKAPGIYNGPSQRALYTVTNGESSRSSSSRSSVFQSEKSSTDSRASISFSEYNL
jgi:hypothetical protein